jgi:hypothetical protein
LFSIVLDALHAKERCCPMTIDRIGEFYTGRDWPNCGRRRFSGSSPKIKSIIRIIQSSSINYINSDNDSADRLFQVGMDLAIEAYCQSTKLPDLVSQRLEEGLAMPSSSHDGIRDAVNVRAA